MYFENEEDLIKKAREACGKTFKEIDQYNRLSKKGATGALGQIIEESFFGYELNSKSEADFANLGIELKVTPFKQNKNKTLSAKERLVLNIINYMEEVHNDFWTSSFWKKNEKLLLMFYEWKSDIDRGDFRIIETVLFTIPEEDLEIIKKDWELIVNKIRAGEAHTLSEGDTLYLGACTKGANKNSVRPQPYSSEMAMQRAYSLKQSYMSALVRQIISNEKLVQFANAAELKNKTIEQLLHERFDSFIGMTMEEMAGHLNIKINPKNRSAVPNLISALLGVKGTKLDKIAEFAKANIQFKTVRLQQSGKPKESMSFVNIDFNEVLQETWEESFIRNYFLETQILFVVFQYDDQDALRFKGIKLWHMPLNIIDKEVFNYWNEIRLVLENGVILTKTNKGIQNNFPKSNFNGILHVRPKGADGNDKVQLPDGQWITKQCYWLNASYIGKIIEEL
ncbi:Sau3AI family type II restriction endonuclease [Lysinibacillus sp. SGAir0095]|uniref:Sau3AI family type II restriction endonuclease n=1 Tax=Lysinibacillus sp. SGAir0095 TaxID=2070463 RepID=UPI0010CD1E4B|nr:Sau3AI family type II restriction endonuclease [Lysinibacillus sp. SGAir0095]QCR31033.1 restriction endonuclease [Lysinibacillus sp. SGAir0095]